MTRFVVDEDLPRATTAMLRELGYEAFDARDCGLRGKSDQEVYDFAVQERAVIITADLGFGNLMRSHRGNIPGLIIVRFPNEISTGELNRQIKQALDATSIQDLESNLMIIEPGRVRIRRSRR